MSEVYDLQAWELAYKIAFTSEFVKLERLGMGLEEATVLAHAKASERIGGPLERAWSNRAKDEYQLDHDEFVLENSLGGQTYKERR